MKGRSAQVSREDWRPRPESNRGARICSPKLCEQFQWRASKTVDGISMVTRGLENGLGAFTPRFSTGTGAEMHPASLLDRYACAVIP